MRAFITILLLISVFGISQNPGRDDCSFNGKKLYGRIQIVDNFEDVRIKIVDNFEDYDIKIVDSNADECGEWQIVDEFPDLKVKFVDEFEDIKIKFVDEFPGKK